MPIRPRSGRGDDELTTPELLEELRESRRVQGELVSILHHDGEARTRRHDAGPRARLLEGALPFLVGLLLGVMGTYATLSGRISTLEAETRQHGLSINALTTDSRETLVRIREVQDDIATLKTRGK